MKPEEAQKVVEDAIGAGYRHLDCAYMYGNEREVGEGIKRKIQEGDVSREDLFITSKVSSFLSRYVFLSHPSYQLNGQSSECANGLSLESRKFYNNWLFVLLSTTQ